MTVTEEHFRSDPARRKELEELLAHPTLAMALEVVRNQELNITNVTHTGGDLMQWYALMGAKRVGYLEAFQNLTNLARVQTTPPKEPKHWENEKEN